MPYLVVAMWFVGAGAVVAGLFKWIGLFEDLEIN